jgi:glycosyltransferase involved in cell wall biosynthesis
LGYRDDAALRRYLTDADIVVNLRNPHSGEASWSVLESTLAGKPTLVWKHGWYDEWPERTVVKVASRGDLVLALERLCREPELRESIGRTAAEYARATFVTARYCERLLAFNDRVRYAAPALRLSEFVSGTLRELGVLASDGNMLARMTDEVAGVSGL